MNLIIALLLLGCAQGARLEATGQVGSHNLNLRKPDNMGISLAQISSSSEESSKEKRMNQVYAMIDTKTESTTEKPTFMAQINNFFDSMNLGLAQETKVTRTDYSALDSAKVDSAHYRPLTVGLLSAFSVIACCFFSQVLAAGAKKSKLRLNKYYQRKKYEKDQLIQYISKQQQEAEIRTQRDQNVVLGGFNSPNRNPRESSQYEDRPTDGEAAMSDGMPSIPNRASHKDDRAKRREQRRTQKSQGGGKDSPISGASSSNRMTQQQPVNKGIEKGIANNQERDTDNSYQQYVRASKGSSGAGSLRRSRDRAQKQENRDVIRETSWDSDKDSKASPKTPESEQNKRSHGTEHSKRSNGSAYDKYNLAEDEEPTTSLLKKQ